MIKNFILVLKKSHDIIVEGKCEVKRVIKRDDYLNEMREKEQVSLESGEWPVYVELTNNKVYGCDFVVSATGVLPAVDDFTKNNKVNFIFNIF